MKTIRHSLGIYLLICSATLAAVHAQKHTVDKANNAFDNLNYINAIEIYTSVVESGVEDPKLIHRLASAHYFNGNFDQAVKWYDTYYALAGASPEFIDNYRYGQALKTQKAYKKADSLLATYYQHKGVRYQPLLAVKKEKETIDNSDVYKNEQYQFNTDLSEYPAFVSNDALYVVGVNLNNKKKKDRNVTSDIFKYDTESDSYLKLPEAINSPYNEGSLTITNDGQTMLFSRNDYLKSRLRKSRKDVTTINIYIATQKNGEWRNVTAFPFNSEEYSVGHPTLSADNRTLYFVSDKPGGKGGIDLYRVPFYEDGSFGEPRNMTELNTEGNEMFPFIDKKDGSLYFSSNGPESLGGLDVFIAKLTSDNTYKRAYNLGEEINSTYDDFAFVIKENREGYYASNKVNDVGMDDIYKFKALKDFEVPLFLKVNGKLEDEDTQTPLAGVTLTAYDKDGNPLANTVTDSNGNYEFEELKADDIAYLKSEKSSYQSVEIEVSKNTLKDKNPVKISMRSMGQDIPESITVNGTLKDVKTDKDIGYAQVSLLDINNNVIATTQTDANGNYELKHVPSDKVAFMRIEKEGYQTEETEVNLRNLDKNALLQDFSLAQDNVALELGNDIASILNTIYFNYGKHAIRPDAEVELQKIVQVLKKFPSMHIMIESHTDSQGTASYNLRLSQRRAKSTYDFLIRHGVNSKRLRHKGYGENKLINNCKNGVECSDVEHQKNRRSAFKIIKI